MSLLGIKEVDSVRDKTSHFFSLVKKYKSHHGPVVSLSSAAEPVRNENSPTKAFNTKAKVVSESLLILTERISKLGILVRDASTLTDNSTEINKLTYDIKHDLKSVSVAIENQLSAESYGVSVQDKQSRSLIQSDLQNRLLVSSQSFTNILEQRSGNLRAATNRRERISGVNHSETKLRKRATRGNPSNLSAWSDDVTTTDPLLMGENSMHEDDHTEQEDATSFSNLLSKAEVQVRQEEGYYQQRATAVESLRTTIEEVASMYRRLNEIVLQQEEMTLRIDADVSDTLQNIELGHNELLTYLEGLSGNGWLLIKVLAIILVFAMLFIVVS